MRTLKTILMIIGTVLIIISFTGCDKFKVLTDKTGEAIEGLKETKIRRNILVLLDVSSSTGKAQQAAYRQVISDIFKSLGQRDRLIVNTLDGGSFTNPYSIIREDFLNVQQWDDLWYKGSEIGLKPEELKKQAPPFYRVEESARAKGPALAKARLDRYKAYSQAKLASALSKVNGERKPFAGATSILWALQNLEPDLESLKNERYKEEGIGVRNYIVILSDMVEESPQANFNKPFGILRVDAEALLKKLNENGQVPALHGSSVICIGRAKTSVIKSEDGVQSVGQFWKAYFSGNYANANLAGYVAIDKASNISRWLNEWNEK